MSSVDPNLLDTKLDEIIRETLDEADDELLVINPSNEAIAEFVRVASLYDGDLPQVSMLADERTLKDATDDFKVASKAADLVDEGLLSLRTTDGEQENSLLITRDSVVALVAAGTSVGGLTTDRGEFIETAFDTYKDEFQRAEEYTLRTPGLSRVRQTLSDEIGPDAEADFTNILDSLETARGDGDGLDEVTISLLVAAKNEVLLYDISRWGEDVGIASKATFSRTKTKLEDMGIVDTEKVPIDVGRPRLRLKFGDDRLKNADEDQIVSIAQSLLA
ncbi:hypothetical protein BRD00_04740 [Halobacteriales archaeon QS_8_69_26]|nr:MAG: hypothetical protein BRD00_04740 [Halobacteriales archaeon QS_8_69_26]